VKKEEGGGLERGILAPFHLIYMKRVYAKRGFRCKWSPVTERGFTSPGLRAVSDGARFPCGSLGKIVKIVEK